MLDIVYVDVGVLNPALYNPRKWSEDQIRQLKASIEKFGLVDPLIVNKAPQRANIVIGGHFRLFVAKELGFKQVPVVFVDIPEEDREKELNLRLNKNAGEFDFKMLGEFFNEDMMKDIGFSSNEIDRAFDLHTEEDEAIEPGENPTAKQGEIYQLGEHRLMCGDSTLREDVEKLMGGGPGQCDLYGSALHGRLQIYCRKHLQLYEIRRLGQQDFQRQFK